MTRRVVLAFALAVALSPAATAHAATTPSPAPSATKSTTTTKSTTAAPAKTTGTVTRPPSKTTKPATAATVRPKLRPGSKGAAVVSLQKRLGALGYWVGAPTGRYDHATAQGVMALQKVAGLGRDGIAGASTWKALDAGVRPKARSAKGRVLEIDLKRQILMLAVDGKVAFVVNTSTGARATATPRGSYRIYRAYDGWRVAPLGKLYRPKYFHRGYAVHGVTDGHIPGYAASHGCARVSTKAMDMMWGRSGLRNGDRVWVY